MSFFRPSYPNIFVQHPRSFWLKCKDFLRKKVSIKAQFPSILVRHLVVAKHLQGESVGHGVQRMSWGQWKLIVTKIMFVFWVREQVDHYDIVMKRHLLTPIRKGRGAMSPFSSVPAYLRSSGTAWHKLGRWVMRCGKGCERITHNTRYFLSISHLRAGLIPSRSSQIFLK